MDSTLYGKVIKGLVGIGIVVVIWMPDVLFELLFEFLHTVWELLWELLDLLFEGMETALDFLIEQLLETDLHTTQVIVFYILIAIILFLIYRLIRWSLCAYRHWLVGCWAKLKAGKTGFQKWFHRMSMGEKLAWLGLVVTAIISRLVFGF